MQRGPEGNNLTVEFRVKEKKNLLFIKSQSVCFKWAVSAQMAPLMLTSAEWMSNPVVVLSSVAVQTRVPPWKTKTLESSMLVLPAHAENVCAS